MDAQQATSEAITARSASIGDDPYRNTEAWGDLPSLRLYLVGHDPARPEAVRQALTSRGCSVLSYVPDDTWLVAGTPQAVREVVAETGAPAVRTCTWVSFSSAQCPHRALWDTCQPRMPV